IVGTSTALVLSAVTVEATGAVTCGAAAGVGAAVAGDGAGACPPCGMTESVLGAAAVGVVAVATFALAAESAAFSSLAAARPRNVAALDSPSAMTATTIASAV